jgi:sec-independent protein translocase protein TatA
MFGNAFSGWHLLVIVFIILLLFGAPKLPALAKSLGQSMKIFKSEVKSDTDSSGDKVGVDPAPGSTSATVDDKPQATGSADSATKP